MENTRAIRFVVVSVTQSILSGPTATDSGWLDADSGISVIEPPGVMRPSLDVPFSANHRLPSGPGAIPCGAEPEGGANSWTVPDVEIRPMAAVTVWPFTITGSVNQRLPSGRR